jgi:hypothetical protein
MITCNARMNGIYNEPAHIPVFVTFNTYHKGGIKFQRNKHSLFHLKSSAIIDQL